MGLVEVGHSLWMLQRTGDSSVHLDRVSTSVSLDELTHTHKAHMQPGLPLCKGQIQSPVASGKLQSVTGGVTLWTPEVSSVLISKGLPFPRVPSRKAVAIWSKVFVKFIAAINVILQEYKQAVALLHYWSIHTSMPKTWNLLMRVKLKWIFSSRNCLGRTLSVMLLGTPLTCYGAHWAFFFACRQNEETPCFILVSIWM